MQSKQNKKVYSVVLLFIHILYETSILYAPAHEKHTLAAINSICHLTIYFVMFRSDIKTNAQISIYFFYGELQFRNKTNIYNHTNYEKLYEIYWKNSKNFKFIL